jgi:hypothetical protein
VGTIVVVREETARIRLRHEGPTDVQSLVVLSV